MGVRFPFEVIKMFWNWIVVIVVQQCKFTKSTEFYTLKWLKW